MSNEQTLRAALERLITVDEAHKTIHAPDGDDIARMIEYSDAFENARAALAATAPTERARPNIHDAAPCLNCGQTFALHFGMRCHPGNAPSTEFCPAALTAQAIPPCAHRIADIRNEKVMSGYMCLDCGAVFAAADHDTPRAQAIPPIPAAYPRNAAEVIALIGKHCDRYVGDGISRQYTLTVGDLLNAFDAYAERVSPIHAAPEPQEKEALLAARKAAFARFEQENSKYGYTPWDAWLCGCVWQAKNLAVQQAAPEQATIPDTRLNEAVDFCDALAKRYAIETDEFEVGFSMAANQAAAEIRRLIAAPSPQQRDATPQQAIPAGRDAAMIDPTEDMIVAACMACHLHLTKESMADMRRALIAAYAAAPQPPAQQEDAKDAARYRWLRENSPCMVLEDVMGKEAKRHPQCELDKAIDAAIAAMTKDKARNAE